MRTSLVGLVLLLGVSSANAAVVSVTAYDSLSVPGGGGWTVDTMDPPVFTYNPNTAFTTGSLPGVTAAPPSTNVSQYLSVNPGNDPVNVTGFSGVNTFGLYWGSIDTYNSLTFWDGLTQVGAVSGTDAYNAAGAFAGAPGVPGTPNQSAVNDRSNKYIIIVLDSVFDRVSFVSTSNAFEVDNLAVKDTESGTSPVPIPGALALFAGGLGVVGLLSRRRRKALATA